jgi:hypothetical protein
MQELNINDIIDLVVAEVPDAGTRIKEMFEWHFERVKIILEWILGITASLFLLAVLAFFKTEIDLEYWQIGVVLIFALCTGTYGLYRLWQLRALNHEFVAALKLFSELKKISPFLVQYHKQTE